MWWRLSPVGVITSHHNFQENPRWSGVEHLSYCPGMPQLYRLKRMYEYFLFLHNIFDKNPTSYLTLWRHWRSWKGGRGTAHRLTCYGAWFWPYWHIGIQSSLTFRADANCATLLIQIMDFSLAPSSQLCVPAIHSNSLQYWKKQQHQSKIKKCGIKMALGLILAIN